MRDICALILTIGLLLRIFFGIQVTRVTDFDVIVVVINNSNSSSNDLATIVGLIAYTSYSIAVNLAYKTIQVLLHAIVYEN